MSVTFSTAMRGVAIKSYSGKPIQHLNRMWIGPLGFSQRDGRVSGA
jgi:hypothetical protein